jgi:N-acyl-D-aspartate/D-glutamate deacylase
MTAILPAELLKHDISEIIAKLQDKNSRESIRNQDPFFWLLIRDKRWDLIRLYHSEKFPHLIGKNVFELAEELQTAPFDALLDILAEEGEQMFGVLMMGKIKRASDLAEIIKYQHCGVISDGLSLSPKGRLKDINWSPGCYGWVSQFFEKFVGKWKPLSLEEGVERITRFAAKRLGMTQRGMIKKGNWADIVVFDDAELKDNSSLNQPVFFSEGIRYVLLNGEIVVQNGRYLGTTSGRVLKRGD